ncbi:MAG TPA: Trk family potassium uptake protein, partial [Firmicutes bacterium]|nr:Trk family potassium uptake protein [Bacillota bacterium]
TMILMFIGGSPGSTAGGIKTTTFAALVISAWSSLKNTKGDSVFGRQLEESALRRANTVVVINLTLVLVSSLVISATKPALPLGDVVFETVSALSTVGLSTGVTGSLGIIGQLMLILLMYTGRVGSISLALLFMQHRMPVSIQKPTERIIIG